MREFIKNGQICTFNFLHTGTKQNFISLTGKCPEVSSHTFEAIGHFTINLLWIDVKVYIWLIKVDCSFVFHLYCPGEPNVHSRYELESETLVGVTCGELLSEELVT